MGGLAAGGVIALSLKGPSGDIVKQVSVTTTAGQTIGDVLTALNSAMGGAATFTLNSDGSVAVLKGHEGEVTSVAFSPDGKKIAFVSNKDGSPRIYLLTIPPPGTSIKDTKAQLISKNKQGKFSPLLVS